MTAAAALLLCAVALTFICFSPLDLSFRGERANTFSADIRATWLFGLVEKRIRTGRKTGEVPSADLQDPVPGKEDSKQDTGREARKSRRRDRRRIFLAVMMTPGFPSRLLLFAGRLLNSVLPLHISVQLRGGFQDPAATGMAFAAVASLSPGLRSIPYLQFAWHPDFERDQLEGNAEARLRLVPARLLWTCGRFAFHPVTVKALLAARREKRR